MSHGVSGDIYVSFSGESGSKIQNVYSITPRGHVNEDILHRADQPFKELRGLAFAPDGRLFVSNANKKATAIYVYEAETGARGRRAWTGIKITPASSAGLWHPYELTFADAGWQLLASSQDTNSVTGFATPVTHTAPAAASPIASYLADNFGDHFFPGTIVGSAVPLANDGFTPTAVPADQGGLNYDAGKKHSVRGIAVSADGRLLFVADEPGHRVTVYETASGSYCYSITESRNHQVENPVGVILNPADGNIYIGSTGNQRIFRHDVGSRTTSVFIHDDHKLSKVSGLAFNPAGDLFTASRDTRKVYRAKAGKKDLHTLAGPFHDNPECLAVVP